MLSMEEAPPPKCAICNDAKSTSKAVAREDGFEEVVHTQCICVLAEQIKNNLGPDLASAKYIESTPLYTPEDRTKDNLFLKGFWPDLAAHIKCALIHKGPMFKVQVVTDEKLRSVYLGHERYTSRPKENREAGSHNYLGDLLGHHHLAIIQLGYLGYKNVAMPGILKEALMLRQSKNLPTWICEVPSSPYLSAPGYTHFAYSESTADYIEQNFEILNLTDPTKSTEGLVPHGMEIVNETVHFDPDTSTVSIALPAQQPKLPPEVKPRFNAPVTPAPGLDDSSSSKKSKFGKKSKGTGPI